MAQVLANMLGYGNYDGVAGAGEPVRQQNAVVTFVKLNELLALNSGSGWTSTLQNDLTLSATTIPLPKRSINPMTVNYLNETRQFAGRPTHDPISLGFKIKVKRYVIDILAAWHKKVYNSVNGEVGYKSEYAVNGWIAPLDTKGNDIGTANKFFNFFGAWPSNFDPGDMDLEGDGDVRATLELQVDKWDWAATAVTSEWAAQSGPV